jgi:hypothetical protein
MRWGNVDALGMRISSYYISAEGPMNMLDEFGVRGVQGSENGPNRFL